MLQYVLLEFKSVPEQQVDGFMEMASDDVMTKEVPPEIDEWTLHQADEQAEQEIFAGSFDGGECINMKQPPCRLAPCQ